jgi:hypothetical protein
MAWPFLCPGSSLQIFQILLYVEGMKRNEEAYLIGSWHTVRFLLGWVSGDWRNVLEVYEK